MTMSQNIIPFTNHKCWDMDTQKDNNVLGNKIAEARKKADMTQPEVLAELERYHICIGVGAYSRWEKGASVPNAYQFLALCEVLHIADPLPYFTGQMPEAAEYSPELSRKGMTLLQTFKKLLIDSGQYPPTTRKTNAEIAEMCDVLTARVGKVSAGAGNWLTDDQMEYMSFPKTKVPDDTDFAVQITGDSMTPIYQDGQYVFVERCQELEPGEVGIFVLNGNAYIKVFGKEMPDESELENYLYDGRVIMKTSLISYNKSYDPIPIRPYDRLDIIGRVLN